MVLQWYVWLLATNLRFGDMGKAQHLQYHRLLVEEHTGDAD
jgi:hypothetical protein